MSEDVSATMRVGITVILVAALVATVLNLMVMSNSLLTGGQTTLQSGIDAVGQQEFAAYNNTKVSGTQVNTALNLFQGRDVAILIQTKSFKELIHAGTESTSMPAGSGFFMNYGALVSLSKTKSTPTASMCSTFAGADHSSYVSAANDYANGTTTSLDAKYTNASTIHGADKNSLYVTFASTEPRSKAAWAGLVSKMGLTAAEGATAEAPVIREDGKPYYTALLYDQNGIVQTNNNVIGTATLGNPQYLLSSARFQSSLIKDNTGSIIGIVFYQIN